MCVVVPRSWKRDTPFSRFTPLGCVKFQSTHSTGNAPKIQGMDNSPTHLSEPTEDKLNIFISSRIDECKDERSAAYNAINSINHNPILFEQIGVRSSSPRNLYLSKLRKFHVMVAIYRDG